MLTAFASRIRQNLHPQTPPRSAGRRRRDLQDAAAHAARLETLESRLLLSAVRLNIPILTPTTLAGDASVTAVPGYLTGTGRATYQITVGANDAGWYELWAAAGGADWQTNVSLDGTLVHHGQLPGIVWANKEGCAKVMNLNLTAGSHTIAFESQFPGLPYLTTAFLVGGVGAWHLLKDKANPRARLMFSMAMWMATIVAPLQIVLGDLHGLNTLEH
ncbi:MAG: cytochrome ubiquinol oxidase subunit I, partial [Phycisphaerae bacterium]